MDALQDACAIWQGGMEGGSSPIRAAARNLTGISHYFQAGFITKCEQEAHDNPVTTARARVLLEALATSPLFTATQWPSWECSPSGLGEASRRALRASRSSTPCRLDS